ncbi:MAG: restriction endonuclease subunit S [Treponema sp.]|nr:restriction endonuclease subunit S [Treponema sp.]
MSINYRKLGDIVELIDERNRDGKVQNLIGVSIDKCFIKSVANTIGTDLTKYQVIRKNDFACSLMQVSRDGKIPIACLKDYDEAIMSPAYYIFRIRNTNEVLPDYLAMWFMRTEFDREASYIAVGGVRGSMPWEDFCDMKLPVPDLKEQEKIVNTYNAITKRIQLKQKINENLEKTAQCLFDELNISKKSFEEKTIAEISNSVICGKTPSTAIKEYWGTDIPFITIPDMHGKNFISQTERYLSQEGKSSQENQTLPPKSICVSCIATVGLVSITTTISQTNQQINSIICKEGISPFYVFMTLKGMNEELKRLGAGGSTTLNISKSLFSSIKIAIPNKKEMDLFENEISPIFDSILMNEKEISKLQELKQLVISRISGM